MSEKKREGVVGETFLSSSIHALVSCTHAICAEFRMGMSSRVRVCCTCGAQSLEGGAWIFPAGLQSVFIAAGARAPAPTKPVAEIFRDVVAPFRIVRVNADDREPPPWDPGGADAKELERVVRAVIDRQESKGAGYESTIGLHAYLRENEWPSVTRAEVLRTLGRIAASGRLERITMAHDPSPVWRIVPKTKEGA
jgi:hypothetical protein